MSPHLCTPPHPQSPQSGYPQPHSSHTAPGRRITRRVTDASTHSILRTQLLVPDWASEYIAYSNLKKTLYAIEKYQVQTTIEGHAHSADIEEGATISSNSEKPSRIGRFLGLKGRYNNDAEVAAAAKKAALHNGSDIFPPESAAFEHGLSKELAKITSFFVRKERELSSELEAVDRQWQLEELKTNKNTTTDADMKHRMSVDLDDEKHMKKIEQSQLKEKMGWDQDGLVDQDIVIDMKSAAGPVTVNGSTVADESVQGNNKNDTFSIPGTAVAFSDVDGSEYNPKSIGRQSSVGDLTEIVWRRECLIESEDEEEKKERKKAKKLKNKKEETRVSMDAPNESNEKNHQEASSSSDAKVAQTEAPRKTSVSTRRSLNAMRDIVIGTGTLGRNIENPNMKPSAYAPLTTEALLRRRLIDTYMLLSELKSYVALNYLGFQKIVKKHDKLARCVTLSRYMTTVVDLSAPFQAESRQQLNAQILRLQAIYARTCTNGSMALAAKELRSHLREYIVWERNTVWRDMVGQERKAEGARAIDPKENEPWMFFGRPVTFITAANARHILLGLLGCVIFAVLMSTSIFDTREQNRCFAILITVAFLWATEVFPLYTTALLVPLLCVWCQVMRDPTSGATLSTSAATTLIFSAMFSPTIMLLLGGFTIASALSKYGIAKAIASSVLSRAGTDPKWVLLANMLVATIASMFISNVAAPVLCFSLIQVRYILIAILLTPKCSNETQLLTMISSLLFPTLVHPPYSSSQVQLWSLLDHGYCLGFQRRWYGLAHLLAPEHHYDPKHVPCSFLG